MRKLLSFTIIAFLLSSCGSKKTTEQGKAEFLDDKDNYFRIELNSNPPHPAFEQFRKIVDVFGVKIYAMADVGDVKLLHAANVLAQYLDNDEDGNVDDPKLLAQMLDNKAFVAMVKTGDSPDLERFFKADPPRDMRGQDLYDEETIPGGAAAGRFDASLEELLHIVNFGGHVDAYPEAFGTEPGSRLANAMDLARGGLFENIPEQYPEDAWYSYYDETCDYGCMAIEYMYWALTSMLGAQDFPGRLERIEEEWKLNTREKVMNIDTAVFSLLTDPKYKMPTVLPDGKYQQ